MFACLARTDRDDRARGAKKNLQNSVQCAEGDTVGVICVLWTAKRRRTAWTAEMNTMWTKKHSTGPGEEKNDDLLIEGAYLHMTSVHQLLAVSRIVSPYLKGTKIFRVGPLFSGL